MVKRKPTEEQLKFIRENTGKMRQVDIAKALGKSPSCICRLAKQKEKPTVSKRFFNVDEFAKLYRE